LNERLIGMALAALPDTPTVEEIHQAAQAVMGAKETLIPGDPTTLGDLVRELEARCLVWVPVGGVLDNPRGHVEWLLARKPAIDWAFWDRYEAFLEKRLNWPRAVVRRLDEVTDEVLQRLEDPERTGPWDRRGLVVGRVQSGKTSTYIGLIAKAADSGYKLIVVLAGLHNSLRSQTQVRLDEGFLGFDTQKRLRQGKQNTRMGAGAMPGGRDLIVHSLTSSANAGDFSLRVAQTQNVMIGGAEPVLLVVKKNKSILENLLRWATTLKQVEDPATGRHVVRNVPLLVIDDEADNASVNTAGARGDIPTDEVGQPIAEYNPSAINGLIRKLLDAFDQKAYVGYTATPFANILSQWNETAPRFGEGLFPRSFILNLMPPSNYMGPTRVFGLARQLSDEGEDQPGLPILRAVDDSEEWVPSRHRKHLQVGALPPSLREAIYSFVLACAARAARGQQPAHNSMLVHVTRFTAVQDQIVEQIKELVDEVRRRLRYGDGAAPDQLLVHLRSLWEDDFCKTTGAFDDVLPVRWEEVVPHLVPATARILVKQVNGTAKDVLDYVENAQTGLTVIAVGGDKLSRGLTLEGLTVSYFLRASRMYDTLMQMGRWFGYRPGYGDLCRLYTTDELIGWFSQITMANEELMQLFDEMVASGATPDDFGLRVRLSPDGLMVTAPAKLRRGREVSVSFKDSTPETTVLSLEDDDVAANLAAAATLVNELPVPGGHGEKAMRSVVWRDVAADVVLRFLGSYRTHPQVISVNSRMMESFVRARVSAGELTHWTVVLASVGRGRTERVGRLTIGLVGRTPLSSSRERAYRIKRIVNPSDECLDLTEGQHRQALEDTRESWRRTQVNRPQGTKRKPPDVPIGWAVRRQRPPDRGLLIIYPLDASPREQRPLVGCAVSFPATGSTDPIKYIVNEVYWEQHFGWETDD